MKLLTEIDRSKNLNRKGVSQFREAVRGITFKGSDLLMVQATQNGSFKFPGGGIDPNETHALALAREVREECGVVVTDIGPALGMVLEYGNPDEPGYEVFKMASYYYFCQVEPVFLGQKLDPYEQAMGFQPIWIGIEEAIRLNKAVASSDPQGRLWWVPRDTFILEMLLKNPFSSSN